MDSSNSSTSPGSGGPALHATQLPASAIVRFVRFSGEGAEMLGEPRRTRGGAQDPQRPAGHHRLPLVRQAAHLDRRLPLGGRSSPTCRPPHPHRSGEASRQAMTQASVAGGQPAARVPHGRRGGHTARSGRLRHWGQRHGAVDARAAAYRPAIPSPHARLGYALMAWPGRRGRISGGDVEPTRRPREPRIWPSRRHLSPIQIHPFITGYRELKFVPPVHRAWLNPASLVNRAPLQKIQSVKRAPGNCALSKSAPPENSLWLNQALSADPQRPPGPCLSRRTRSFPIHLLYPAFGREQAISDKAPSPRPGAGYGFDYLGMTMPWSVT